MVSVFGWQFKKIQEKEPESFAPEVKDDGAVMVAAGGAYGTFVDLEGTARTEAELVAKYREIALQPEVEKAIDDIINEAIDTDDSEIISINLDKLEFSENIKEKVNEELIYILQLLNFNTDAYEIFKRWYVDGRLYFHAIIDPDKPSEGLKEIRYIDPRKIRKVREVNRTRKGQATIQNTKNEYFIYSDRSFLTAGSNAGLPLDYVGSQGNLKIAADSIIHVTSGLMDKNNQMVFSHLQKAIKPLNQLRTLEDATAIYRISRAPERRIFYIDVGNLPKMKAEQYMRDMMVRHKNRLVYDSNTGEVRDDRKFMTTLEDYWLPRREGNRGTEITTLPGGQGLGEMTDVEYFKKKLYESLSVPVTRLQSEAGFNLGRASEISRDEVRFGKFVNRLRKRFSMLLYKALEKQLILKGIVSAEEWPEIKNDISFDYATDNHFSELKYSEIMINRMNTLNQMENYIGTYFSREWVRKNILMQTDDDIEDMEKQVAEEKAEQAPPEEKAPQQDTTNNTPDDTTGQ